jgi:hypothetical protein
MFPRLRQIAHIMLVSCVLIGTGNTSLSVEKAPVKQGVGEEPTSANLPEVRMRKLHLVRPDLIPYPIAYDVYC